MAKNADDLQVEMVGIIKKLVRDWNRTEAELVYLVRETVRFARTDDQLDRLYEGGR